jgi:RNA recognition motif-containing protein
MKCSLALSRSRCSTAQQAQGGESQLGNDHKRETLRLAEHMEAPQPKKVPRRTLYVGGLEENVNEELVHAAFIPFGDLVEVQIPRDWKAGTNRGFAFVEYEEEEDAAAAMENMDGSELAGRVLKVNQAKPLKHKLGSTKAVWSADEWFKGIDEGDDMINATADDLPNADTLEPQNQ